MRKVVGSRLDLESLQPVLTGKLPVVLFTVTMPRACLSSDGRSRSCT